MAEIDCDSLMRALHASYKGRGQLTSFRSMSDGQRKYLRSKVDAILQDIDAQGFDLTERCNDG